MIEIFAIYKLCVLFGRQLRAKGREPVWYQVLFVFLWFFFEFAGGFFGAIFFGRPDSTPGVFYLFGLLGFRCRHDVDRPPPAAGRQLRLPACLPSAAQRGKPKSAAVRHRTDRRIYLDIDIRSKDNSPAPGKLWRNCNGQPLYAR